MTIDSAKSAINANMGADFARLAPYLHHILSLLPVLAGDTAVTPPYPADKAATATINEAMQFLQRAWVGTVSNAQELRGLTAVTNDPNLLQIRFQGCIWSAASMERLLIVARTAVDTYQLWHYEESRGIGGGTKGYKMPRIASR